MNQALLYQGVGRNTNVATYGCTALNGTNKVGLLKPDADGYWELILGALNIYNNVGAFWPYDDAAKSIFEKSSQLMRRISGGALYGESGHPRRLPGMSEQQYINRIIDIIEENVSHHIAEVRIDPNLMKDNAGRPLMAIVGKVKPAGDKGAALLASLQNPKENVAFSVRSLTHDYLMGNTVVKSIRNLVTWDRVIEPGLSVATKYNNPSCESFADTELRITPAKLRLVIDNNSRDRRGMESSDALLREMMRDMGWSSIEIGPAPPSSRW